MTGINDALRVNLQRHFANVAAQEANPRKKAPEPIELGTLTDIKTAGKIHEFEKASAIPFWLPENQILLACIANSSKPMVFTVYSQEQRASMDSRLTINGDPQPASWITLEISNEFYSALVKTVIITSPSKATPPPETWGAWAYRQVSWLWVDPQKPPINKD